MFKDAIYLSGRIVRTVEDSSDFELLDKPYVYRTVRFIDNQIEQLHDEVASLQRAYASLFGVEPEIDGKQLEKIVGQVMARNLYMGRSANAEIRLYRHEGEPTLFVSSGALLDSDCYESAVVRPSAQTLPYEIPHIEHHTSILRQTLSLHPSTPRKVNLLCHNGAVVSCEGFPLYGVIDDHIISYTPWSSPESMRAEELIRKYGKPFEKGVLTLENSRQPEELFTLTTNSLVSLSRINNRPLNPFLALALGNALLR